jgi:cellobiose phosphorylase
VYQKLCPINNGMKPDEYVAEPYVTPGNIEGPDSPQYGRGGWTWYTGSAAWLQKVIVDWILGVRASEEGLVVDPCIPKEWNGFNIKRKFRNTNYNITVINNNHVSNGVKKIEVDGVAQETSIIKSTGKKSSTVKVFMG